MRRIIFSCIAATLVLGSCTGANDRFTKEEGEEITRIAATADSLLTPDQISLKRTMENDFWDLYWNHVSFDDKNILVFDASPKDFKSRGLDMRWYNMAKDNVADYNDNIQKIAKEVVETFSESDSQTLSEEEFYRQMRETFERQKSEYLNATDKSKVFRNNCTKNNATAVPSI